VRPELGLRVPYCTRLLCKRHLRAAEGLRRGWQAADLLRLRWGRRAWDLRSPRLCYRASAEPFRHRWWWELECRLCALRRWRALHLLRRRFLLPRSPSPVVCLPRAALYLGVGGRRRAQNTAPTRPVRWGFEGGARAIGRGGGGPTASRMPRRKSQRGKMWPSCSSVVSRQSLLRGVNRRERESEASVVRGALPAEDSRWVRITNRRLGDCARVARDER